MMKKFAFKMKLKSGCADEYKKRHNHIWPELKRLLSDSGIRDYAIYLDKDSGALFAMQTLSDNFDNRKLSEHPIMRKWWAYMADLMETNDDNSPVYEVLEEMFYME